MSAVDVEIAEDIPSSGPGADSAGPEAEQAPPPREERSYRKATPPEVEIEREVTKRQIIESVTSVLVVILYMIFTLVRDRDAGVVVIDPDERDDWAE
jgi:hypothetical protein